MVAQAAAILKSSRRLRAASLLVGRPDDAEIGSG
jgi:hypothetical protein